MEGGGFASGALVTVDYCLKYGKALVETCAAFKEVDDQTDERVLSIRTHWKRTSLQLDFLKRVWQSLNKEHQGIQHELFHVLISKLRSAIAKLDGLGKSRGHRSTKGKEAQVRKWQFVLVKNRLDQVIYDLTRWQQSFDPVWFLIMKVSDPAIDDQLRRHGLSNLGSVTAAAINASGFRNAARDQPRRTESVFLQEDGLRSALIHDIAHSSAKWVQRAVSDLWLIVDSITCDAGVDTKLVARDMATLAQKLSCTNPHTFGILQCHGVVRVTKNGGKEASAYEFVFNTPKEFNTKPATLRSHLAARLSHSLTNRLGVAKQLARSISYVHTLGLVHKNVRPETFLGFTNSDSTLGLFFLIGFEKIRLADGRTIRKGHEPWERNLYRHPDRQGVRLEEAYTMQHDIYSLGVCLLEIGLWDSFVSYNDAGTGATTGPALDLKPGSTEFEIPWTMKTYLVALAKHKLPVRMGDTYAEIVLKCLTCLDLGNADFGDKSDFEDADGVLVGVRYIEKIMLKLESIQV